MSKVRLGDVAKEHKETCKGDKSDYPIVGLEHLEPECITLSQWSESTDNTFSKVFRKGHVLFGRRRAYLKKAAVAPFDGICSGDITVIEAIPGRIIPELLPFVIQNDALLDFAVGRSAGSLSPRVKWEHLKNYEFELPASEEEQRKLADVLWSIEQTRKSYNSLLRATDELVKSQFIELFGDPVYNSGDWKRSTFGKEFEIFSGGTPSTSNADFWNDGTIPWIGSNMCQDLVLKTTDGKYITNEGLLKSSTKWVHPGYVLVALVGATIGKTALLTLSTTINQNMAAINVPSNPNFTAEYIFMLMRHLYSRFVELGNGGFKMANLSFVRSLPLPMPPLELQNSYSELFQQLDKSKFELEQALSELTLTYKRILAENLG